MADASSGDNRPVNMWEELNKPKEGAADSQQNEDERDDKAGVPLAGMIGGAVAIAAVAFAGFVVMGGGDDVVEPEAVVADGGQLALTDAAEGDVDGSLADGSVDADGADSTDGAGSDDDAGTTDPRDGAGDPAEGDAAVEGSTDPSDDAAVYSPETPMGAEGNYSVLSRGKLYLRGEVPSPLISIGAVSALEQIMGEGNVVSELVINPDAPFEMGAASDVFIEDTVLFGLGSAEIAPDFYPLLGLGVVLLQVQEGVTIEVYGHTDSTGSDEVNLALSQARVDAVQAFWVSQGGDPDRITAVGLGESEPVADNETAEGRKWNRRVEMVISGFVFSL